MARKNLEIEIDRDGISDSDFEMIKGPLLQDIVRDAWDGDEAAWSIEFSKHVKVKAEGYVGEDDIYDASMPIGAQPIPTPIGRFMLGKANFDASGNGVIEKISIDIAEM